MSFQKYFDLIQNLDFYVRRKATGDPNQLAKKLHISRSTVLRFIKDLKNLGVPIKYSKNQNSYFYSEHGQITRSLYKKFRVISSEEQKKINIEIVSKLINFCEDSKVSVYDTAYRELCLDLIS